MELYELSMTEVSEKSADQSADQESVGDDIGRSA
ncbi:hypothetical protein HNP02_006670 [Mycobacterium sp. AZCC_0083]|nr:hypothetical protein [Mycobacterium sp. AZCC_0083]